MNDEPIEKGVTAGVVSLEDLLLSIVSLKKRALVQHDKNLFEGADRIEHNLKLLMDKNTVFERW